MNALRVTPVILSLLLLGAHFFRTGQLLLPVLFVLLALTLFVRHRWVPWVLQLVLVLGTLEWLWTLYTLILIRMAHGQPWTRLAIILGAIALLTALSGLVFRTRALKARYKSSAGAMI